MERISESILVLAITVLMACTKPPSHDVDPKGNAESDAKKGSGKGAAIVPDKVATQDKSGQPPDNPKKEVLPKDEAENIRPIVEAQPRLPTIDLLLGPKEKKVVSEVATKERERNAGLMFREKLNENEGMIFVFETSQQVGFYMRNTTIKLSAAYIGRTGRIIEIYDLKPLEEAPVNSQSDIIQFVLEMPRGWFKRHGVRIGHRIMTAKGELDEVLLKH
ncbi:MAG: DUF192 domain-containing protein [Verrucomicrobiota bacterium]|nr:DUF192 domain-containing protein [Verrucomicrobiota bacterium]